MTAAEARRRAFHPERFTLSNGLRVLLVENDALPSISLAVTVLAGAGTDPEEHAGLAFMASRLLNEGTATRTSLEIADAIESVGGAIDCDSSHDRTTAYLSVLRQDIELGLDLMVDVIANPAFSPASIDNERNRVLAEIRSAEDRPQVIAGWEFNELIYRGHPLHRPAHGYPETLKRIERSNLDSFHREHIRPGNAILAAVGDFKTAEMLDRLEHAFARWLPGNAPRDQRVGPVRQTDVRRKFLPISSQQAHVFFGHLGIRRTDPDYYAIQVLDTILGGAGLTSRIPRKLRDEQGLAYTTFASLAGSAGINPGKFVAYIGTSPENVERAISGFVEEVDRIIVEPVGSEELAAAQAYLTGSFVFGFETNAQIARFLINAEVFGLGFDYVEQYPKYIAAVDAAQITRVAAEHLSTTSYTLVIAGPDDDPGLRRLGAAPAE